jgi:hypothetical protein
METGRKIVSQEDHYTTGRPTTPRLINIQWAISTGTCIRLFTYNAYSANKAYNTYNIYLLVWVTIQLLILFPKLQLNTIYIILAILFCSQFVLQNDWT